MSYRAPAETVSYLSFYIACNNFWRRFPPALRLYLFFFYTGCNQAVANKPWLYINNIQEDIKGWDHYVYWNLFFGPARL